MWFKKLRQWIAAWFAKPSRPARKTTNRLHLEGLEGRWVPSTLTVGGPHGANNYSTITAALTAAKNGDTIRVSDGVYAESVTITKNGIDLVAEHSGRATIIAPTNIASNTGIINIIGATCVEVEGFVVDGNHQPLDAAIRVLNHGSADIHNNTIQNTFSGPSNPYGYGIRVGDNGDPTGFIGGSALVTHNVITGYEKGGIIIDGNQSAAVVKDNTITGIGPTAVVAQNGVQVGFGATAIIVGNTISQNNYSAPGDITALGVLIYQTSRPTLVSGNDLSQNGSGLQVLQASDAFVIGNTVRNSLYDGIILTSATNTEVEGNCVTHSGGDGVSMLDSSGNEIEDNNLSGSVNFGGVYLESSNHNEIEGNELDDNSAYGIQLVTSNNNAIQGNRVTGTGGDGISLTDSTGNRITGNVLVQNVGLAIRLTNSPNNQIYGNQTSGHGGDCDGWHYDDPGHEDWYFGPLSCFGLDA